MSKNAIGLATGLLLGLAHLVWVILVAVNLAKPLMDFVLGLHSLEMSYTILPINWVNSLILIVLTFVVGYIIGWVLAALLGAVKKGKK